MRFSDVFNVFSKRTESASQTGNIVNKSLKNKIIMLCQDAFENGRYCSRSSYHFDGFWDEIHKRLSYLHGRFQLTEDRHIQSVTEDVVYFLYACNDNDFFDFIELIFKVECLFHAVPDENILVSDINEIFSSEDIPYVLTDIVKETVTEPINGYPSFGREGTVIKVVSHPKIIKKENMIIHSNIIKPTLEVLLSPMYKTANLEFLEALEDYKKGDYGDCLTKCCSSFESVMKIICDTKGWSYNQNDSASALIKNILNHAKLDQYFEQHLIIIATLRNKLSKSHGAGMHTKSVSKNIAQYAINSTGSAIIFLVNETK